jgi:pyruvate/2-oxoglutarate dehydrogenase complex dihydrolipoamide dehydrogenase (E3) component
MGVKHGFVKILCDPKKGTILGCQIAGPHASDMIHEFSAIMFYKGTVHDVVQIPHYHPTLGEIVTYPAEELVEKLASK